MVLSYGRSRVCLYCRSEIASGPNFRPTAVLGLDGQIER